MWILWSVLLLGVSDSTPAAPRPLDLDDVSAIYSELHSVSRPLHLLPNTDQQTIEEVALGMQSSDSDPFLHVRGRLPPTWEHCTDCTVLPTVELVRVLKMYLALRLPQIHTMMNVSQVRSMLNLSEVHPTTNVSHDLTCNHTTARNTDTCLVLVDPMWVKGTVQTLSLPALCAQYLYDEHAKIMVILFGWIVIGCIILSLCQFIFHGIQEMRKNRTH